MRMKLMLAALFFGALSVPLLCSLAQPQRGQGVRIKVETGQEMDLYDESHALVIGVRKYTGGWRELPGAERDAEVVSAVLRKQGFRVTVALNPTAAQLNDALSDFISDHGLPERNRLLVYFAGHGHTESLADGRELGYIVPADAPLPDRNPQLFSRRAISMDEIEAKALRIRSKHAMFVFDSCFSGSIFEVRAERYAPPEIESKTAAPVRLFITAGTKNQPVPDDSIFRLYFVRAFEQREGDLNRDGFITGEELGMYLSGRVASDSRDTQTPRYGKIKNARLNLGDVVFALPRRESQPPTIAPDRCAIAWDSIKGAESEQVIEDFLAGCKESPQAFAASLWLSDLRARRRPVAPDPAPPALTPIITLPSGVPISALRSAMITTATVDADGRATRQQAGPIQFYQEDLGGGVKLEMVAVPGGRFQMGSPSGESGRKNHETQHWVRVSDFWIGRYEVTQAQWKAVMGSLPPFESEFKGDDLPVVNVSWEEAQEFIRKLNARLSNANYRLPREAEWEFAARGGKSTPFGFGATITPEIANYNGNYPYGNAAKGKYQQQPAPVGSLGVANAFGLFDMHGNVFEWCENWYGSYTNTEATDPTGPGMGSIRVNRGGGWIAHAVYCRSANRSSVMPGARFHILGFRLLRTYR